jgi:hypothetical protein
MGTDTTPPNTLEASVVALEAELAQTEEAQRGADAALDAAMDRARAEHADAIKAIQAQRQELESQIKGVRAALERQRLAQAKAQAVIQETLGHATLGAILRARLEETCGDLDEATVEGMVAAALAGLPNPQAARTPTGAGMALGQDVAAPTRQGGDTIAHTNVVPPETGHVPPPPTPLKRAPSGRAEPEGTAAQHPPASAPNPEPPSFERTGSGTSSDGPNAVPVLEPPSTKPSDGEGFTDTDIDLDRETADPKPPANRTPATKTSTAKPPVRQTGVEPGGTKVLTFEEGDVLGPRPGWAGNPFKR